MKRGLLIGFLILMLGVVVEMMNLSKPVTVEYNGNILYKDKVYRSESNIKESIAKHMDKNYIFSAKIQIQLKE